ncbi:hypothetical protein GCM10022255_088840 [Dactylosporangium darangshiense]|uniref:Tetratricopeptide repeat protein n=1 Tax=Dactylosporangium darangshiense TaxID=579108 RepID=A0ABP8DNM2_9ACTN
MRRTLVVASSAVLGAAGCSPAAAFASHGLAACALVAYAAFIAGALSKWSAAGVAAGLAVAGPFASGGSPWLLLVCWVVPAAAANLPPRRRRPDAFLRNLTLAPSNKAAIAPRVEPQVRLVSLAAYAAALAPAAAAVVLARQPLPLLVGGLVSLLMLGMLAALRPLTRYSRRDQQFKALLRWTAAALVAAGPIGGAIVSWWRDHVAATHREALVAVVLAGLPVLIAEVYDLLRRRREIRASRRDAVLSWAFVLVEQGLFAFLASVSHADPAFLRFAGWLALFLVPLQARNLWRSRSPAHELRRLDAGRFGHMRIGHIDDFDAWVHDAVIARRDRAPDLALLHTLAAETRLAAAGAPNTGLQMLTSEWSGTGRAARQWLRRTEPLVWRMLYYTDNASPAVARAFDLARADLLTSEAAIARLESRREEEAAAYQAAAELLLRHGLPNLAAERLVDAGLAQLFWLGQPAQTLTTLAPVLDDQRVTPTIRRMALAAAGAAARVSGDSDRAQDLDLRARFTFSGWLDTWHYTRESLAAGLGPASGDTFVAYQQRGYQFITAWAGRKTPQPRPRERGEIQYIPTIDTSDWAYGPARTLAERAARQWGRGRYDAAADAYERAAGLLVRDGYEHNALNVRQRLGRALYGIDPPRAIRNLTAALDLQEQARLEVLDPEVRMHLGGDTEDTYEDLINLLAAVGPQESTRAFELVEHGRSRALLELLGDGLPAAGHLPPELAAEERAADERLKALRAGRRDITGLQNLRQARDGLVAVWDRIAADPASAEYATLRRGDPLTFQDVREMLR